VSFGAACGSASGSDADATATRAAARPSATATPGIDLSVFRGFAYPIQGACLPQNEDLMPNAPREYRGGVHEGVDFYDGDACTGIKEGTPIVAAKDGTVVRADLDYHDLTQEELAGANELIAQGRPNDFKVIDLFRGRQVWVEHDDGIISRYAHTSAIAAGVEEGATVAQGQTIAFVGDSGTPESLGSPGTELHLHFELRAGDTFLGSGLAPEEVRALYENLFTPLDP
jgi:murein DD-endopeptidase MepM/ murein hydrolase activator NlpD